MSIQRNYAFERSDIPLGENYALKINYPFKVVLHSKQFFYLNNMFCVLHILFQIFKLMF